MTTDSYEALMQSLRRRYGVQEQLGDEVPELPVKQLPRSQKHVHLRHATENETLRQQLLGHIYSQTHKSFEMLIIDVLLKMGYGSRRRDLARCIGGSHDGGVDGIIQQDELALDVIYVQAKRLKPSTTVPVAQVRDFVGSLDSHHANKGIFVTTALFSQSASDFVQAVSRRVVLVNGSQLADIMIRHNIGVRIKETIQFKELEPTYFAALG